MAAATTPLEVTSAVQRLGENVRLARIRRGLSQAELAQACGITRKTLYTLEKGASGATVTTAFTVLWKLGLLNTAVALADPEADEHGRSWRPLAGPSACAARSTATTISDR
ncbi:MAG: helix-turn-helix domain-containing protein [Ideonella sp.]|nr:helix-turn-helix domain-containing protein [Ideonella sp.]